MSTSKKIGIVSCVLMVICLVISLIFANGNAFGIRSIRRTAYEDKIFDTSYVHDIQIVIDDWDKFCENATDEEYSVCDVLIDGKKESSVGIRAKGNSSLSSVKQYGNNRYSLKIEFDHYKKGNTYYGLDKLCLNNIINDATYMKDYLSYTMMADMGVKAPLCSYANVSVNGEEWGLFLAVEAIEDSFITRVYGSESGELYKPDNMNMGGGKGFGKDFDMDEVKKKFENGEFEIPEGGDFKMPPDGDFGAPPEGFGERKENGDRPGGGGPGGGGPGGFGGFGGMGSNSTKLIYTDDNPESYSALRDNAKTDVTDADFARLISSIKQMNEQENLEEVLDIDSIIRYFAIHDYIVSGDSYTGGMVHNYYLYEGDGVLDMIAWDYNDAYGTFMSMGSSENGPVNDDIDDPVNGGYEDRPMLAWILDNDEYKEQYHEVLREFIEKWYASGLLNDVISETEEMISPYVEKDPTAFCTYDEFKAAVPQLKKYCELRFEAVQNQINGDYTPIDTSELNLQATVSGQGFGGGPGKRGDWSGKPQWKPDDDRSGKIRKN